MSEDKHDLSWLNELEEQAAVKELLKCCGSREWAKRMAAARPFNDHTGLSLIANEVWWGLDRDARLEAFRSHPKIGEQQAATKVSKQAQEWSGNEQAGIQLSSQQTLSELAHLNEEYYSKFGYIFIVCATDKSASEILNILKSRLKNDPDLELGLAAREQQKITEIRLNKLVAARSQTT